MRGISLTGSSVSNISASKRIAPSLGAHKVEDGVVFAVFSRHASAMSLVLFDHQDDVTPSREIALDPERNKAGDDVWFIKVAEVGHGQLYLWRADGPYKPEDGHRFNRNKLLIDPYARALTNTWKPERAELYGYDPESMDGDLSFSSLSNAGFIPKCIVVHEEFDWQGDHPLNYPLRDCILYEAHLAGLTQHKSSDVEHPGTYLGVIEKIPYLKALGVTSLELLPVHDFNSFDTRRVNPETDEMVQNYWGYNTLSFFAPKSSYAHSAAAAAAVSEFKLMVRELHAAGIEVILDVVFNHSGEGNQFGPTYNFRGLDNSMYYMLEDNKRHYRNYSGCGNTMSCNTPVMADLILDSLRYWVSEMHVDGFRFDLASVLSRDARGRMMNKPPVLEHILNDPILKDTKLIAEPWDAGGAYQVGSFPGTRWAEWNDRFRDDVRRFWNRDVGAVGDFATRLSGSADLYAHNNRKPFHSINFITSHDGFTLRDVVSYNRKHNRMNGEDNRDGHDRNLSYNFGIEGESENYGVEQGRVRHMKNFMATLLLAIGTPMITAGDEFGRTQKGNNNAYCQNNEVSWLDYGLIETYQELFVFTRHLIQFRLRHPALRRTDFYTGEDRDRNDYPDIAWFDSFGRPVNWTQSGGRLGARMDGSRIETGAPDDDNDFYLMINANRAEIEFALAPARRKGRWKRVIDTSLPFPQDFLPEEDAAALLSPGRYRCAGRSLVLLISDAQFNT